MMPAMVDDATFPDADAFPNADIPLPEGMPPSPAAAAVVGPLPYNFKMNADGVSFDEYGYSDTADAYKSHSATSERRTTDCSPLQRSGAVPEPTATAPNIWSGVHKLLLTAPYVCVCTGMVRLPLQYVCLVT
jgi:hypothetical protein